MKKKILMALALIGCAIVLVAGTIAGTVAYLTSTATVTNTFTVGNVTITMDETDTDDSSATDRDTANAYHLLPGKEYTKDPIIHVDATSEDCWLFVKVVDEIAGIQDTTTVAAQMAANGWTLVDGTDNIYAYRAIAEAEDDVPVFESFKIKSTVTNELLAQYAGKTIVVTAYAIQADGFATAAAAWTAANGAFN